jgi:cytochrome c553
LPRADRRNAVSGGARTKLRVLAAAIVLLLPAIAFGADAIELRLAACLACHGDKERAALPLVPALGAQPVDYLTIQLYLFREKMRAVEPMTQMLAGIKDDELKRLAEAIAKLPPPQSAAGAPDPLRAERAQALVVQHRCNFCHTSDFSGQQNVPRLAGQREDYLLKALREYKSNTRRGYDAAMADVLYPLTDQDLLDLANFLSHR